MNILFTGASSFTGYWFVKALAASRHKVLATFTKNQDAYKGIQKKRIDMLKGNADLVYEIKFGDEKFLDLLGQNKQLDMLCHHGADAGNHNSPDFDVPSALANNTNNLPTVLDAMSASGCNRIMLTGSYFEAGEGGQKNSGPVNAYGLSKTFTTMCFKHHCSLRKITLGHFVIPNPFGPFEDDRQRFTTYLMEQWLTGKAAMVTAPEYVRDNIHVGQLAFSYNEAVNRLQKGNGTMVFRPSGYVERQGEFAHRVSGETKKRSKFDCEVIISKQSDFNEPTSRHNSELVNDELNADEDFWDEFVSYYMKNT